MSASLVRQSVATGSGGSQRRRRFRRAIATAELIIGAAGLAGGTMLAVRPDGGLLGMGATVIARTPFADWRTPGILLALFVGVGLLVAAAAELRRWRSATALSIAAGIGLIAFELVEYLLMGWYLLQGIMAAAGLLIALLACFGGVRASTTQGV